MELDGQNLPLSHGGMSNVSTFQNTLVLSKVISLSKKGEGKGNGTIKHLLCKHYANKSVFSIFTYPTGQILSDPFFR